MRAHALLSVVVLVGTLASCYEPTYVEGLACAETDFACPPGQRCIDRGGGQLRCYFQDPTDAGAGACTLVPQSGCPTGQRCTVNRLHNPTTLCVNDGSMNLGDACVGFGQLDECAPGLVCLDRICRQLCAPAVDDIGACSSSNEECISFLGWSACLTKCDVIAQTCSTTGDSCYVNEGAQTFCIPTEANLNLDAACTFTSQCGVGMGCFGGVCRQYCQLPDGTCPPNKACTLEFTNPNNVGLCK